ncbi:MAG: thrombospondin type-1 domain-containing protein [Bdellovibrionota bacterium]
MRDGIRNLKIAALTGLLLLPTACFKSVEFKGTKNTDEFISPNIDANAALPTCKFATTPPTWVRSNSFATTFSCKEPRLDPEDLVESVECNTSRSLTWNDCMTMSQNTFSALSDGGTTLKVRARTRKGVEGPEATLSVRVDSTPPSIDTLRFDGLSVNVPTFSISASDEESGLDKIHCRVGNADSQGYWYECGSYGTQSLSVQGLLKDKQYLLEVKAYDKATNESPISSVSFNTNFIAPSERCVISTVASPTRLKSSNIGYVCASEQRIARRECRLDSGGWATCTSNTSQVLSNLTEGTHNLAVRFVNTEELASPETSISWIVDLTPPRIDLTSAVTPGLSGRFSYDVSDANGINRTECAVGTKDAIPAYTTCSQTYAVDNLSPGKKYIFYVKATDRAGNVGQIQYEWDTTPPTGLPVCTIQTNFPNNYGTSADLTTNFSCSSPNGPVNFPECRVGDSPWISCSTTTSHVITGLNDSQNARFCVRTVDQWNRSSGDTNCVQWKVSLSDPVMNDNVVDVAHPYGNIFFSAKPSSCPVSKYECKLQGPSSAHDWHTCTSPTLYSGLVLNADYTFSSRAVTLCGQTAIPRNTVWRAKATYYGPTCRLVPADSSNWINGSRTQARVECDATAVATSYECSDDGTNWTACVSPVNVDAPRSGSVVKYVRGVDDAGIRGKVSQTSWNFDLEDPTATIQKVAYGPDRLEIFFTASDAAGSGIKETQCRIDGVVDWTRCTSPALFTQAALFTAGKAYVAQVKAIDNSGRSSAVGILDWQNGNWSAWGACVATGNSGQRTRSCSNPAAANGGLACAGAVTEACTPPPPPTCTNGTTNYPTCTTCPAGKGFNVSGVCKPLVTGDGWGTPGGCSVSCGGGVQSRSCVQPNSEYSGSTCSTGQTQIKSCNVQACCLASGTYLGRGDVPGYSRSEVTCHSSAGPSDVVRSDSAQGCCSSTLRYSSPRVKTLITCGPGTNCSFCSAYVPGKNSPNHNWDDWAVYCK